MKKLIHICFCFVIIISISCNKENWWIKNSKVFGKCTDQCTGLPMKDIVVELWGGDKYATKRKQIGIAYTDSEGNYEFKYYKEKKDYWIELSQCPFTYLCFSNNNYIIRSKYMEINFSLVSASNNAQVNLVIKNTSPYNNNDSIHINITEPNNVDPDYSYWLPHSYPTFLVGSSIDTTSTFSVSGCSPLLVKYNWTVTKNGVTNSFRDSVVYSPGVTGQYNLNY